MGTRIGITNEELAAVEGDYRNSDLFTDLEKNAIELAEYLTSTPADVPQDLYDAFAAELSPAQMVELTETIAIENHRARFNRAFDIGSQHFCEIKR